MKTITKLAVALTALFAANAAQADGTATCKFKNGSEVMVQYAPDGVVYSHFNKQGVNDLNLSAAGKQRFLGTNSSSIYLHFMQGDCSYVVVNEDYPASEQYNFFGVKVFKGHKLISKQQCVGDFKSTDSAGNANGTGLDYDLAVAPEENIDLPLN